MNNIIVNVDQKTIVLKKKFEIRAKKFGTAEFRELQEVRRDFPDYVIVSHKIKKAEGKKTYKNLTYDYMRMYIDVVAPADNKDKLNSTLERLILISKCHNKGFGYAKIKEWFLNTFPEIANFEKLPEVEDLIENVININNDMPRSEQSDIAA